LRDANGCPLGRLGPFLTASQPGQHRTTLAGSISQHYDQARLRMPQYPALTYFTDSGTSAHRQWYGRLSGSPQHRAGVGEE